METRRQKRQRKPESGHSSSSESSQSPQSAQSHPPSRSAAKPAERQGSPAATIKKPKRDELEAAACVAQQLHTSYDFFPSEPAPFMRRSQPSAHHQAQVAALRSRDPGEVLQTLSRLHQQLVLAQDDTFSSFPVEQYLPALVDALSQSSNPESGVLAVKSLSQILDAVPNAARLLALSGGISLLCSRLSNFEYIDTAESVIRCLEKVVHEQAGELLKENAVLALLTLVEVLEAPTQKSVFVTVGGLLRAVTNAEVFMRCVAPAMSVLERLVKFQGQEFATMSEMALDCYLALMVSMERMDPSQARQCMESASSPELLFNLLGLTEALPRLSSSVLRLLRSLCRFSISSLKTFLALDAAKFIARFLDGEEQLTQDALCLTASLLPGPHDKAAAEFFQSKPEYLKQLGAVVLPKILRAYDSSSSRGLKRVSLDIVDRLLARGSPQQLQGLITPRDVARFLRELLDSRDVVVVKTALKLTSEIYEKMQEDVTSWLTREGVVAKVAALAKENGLSELFDADSRSKRGAKSRTDTQSMEQLIAQIRQRAQRTNRGVRPEDIAGMRPRTFDQAHESKSEFQKLAGKVAEKCRACEDATSGSVLVHLCTLRDRFLRGEDPVEDLLDVLTCTEDATSYEICGSDVLNALWTWLTNGETEVSVFGQRLHRFLMALLREAKDGELLLAVMVRKIVSVLRFAHSFQVVIQELGQLGGHFSLRTLTQRAFVTLHFQPDLSPDASAVSEKAALFARVPQLSVYLELYQTLDSVREALTKVKCVEDLAKFSGMFQRPIAEIRGSGRDKAIYRYSREDLVSEDLDPREVMDRLHRMEDEEDSEMAESEESQMVFPVERKDSLLSATLVAKLFFNRSEVLPGTTVFELTNRSGLDAGEGVTVQFAYFPLDVQTTTWSQYLRSGPSLLRNLLEETESVGIDHDAGAYIPLRLLKLLNACNRHMTSLISPASLIFPACRSAPVHAVAPPQTFYSQQMSALLGKQLQDIIAMAGGILPDWAKDLPRKCSFLFPFPLRVQLLRSWALGPLKALSHFSQKLKNTPDSFQVRMPRHKVGVLREKLLECAQRVMRDRALLQTGLLEFDFQGEEGTGKGPTLEFYALASRAIRLLPIWRNAGEETGLFPSPTLPPHCEELFEFVGRLVGKALIDERLLDLPLSPSFWKLVFRAPLVLTDVLAVDKQLGSTLLELQSLLNRRLSHDSDLTLRGSSVSDLSLTFTLPGYDDFELKPNGKATTVTLQNLEEYLELVATTTLMQTVASEAFRKGLETLVPIDRLRLFTVEELECLICGEQDEDWKLETLAGAVVAAHGYTKTSTAFQQVLLVMSQFSSDERKLFLQFVTGSPRLPLGGFYGLSPSLTVVRRDTETPVGNADDYLPSVMTCQNYLKIPLYSSFEILRRQLLYACSEGHESFHLS